MQQLEIEHKKAIKKVVNSEEIVIENKREGKGRILAVSRKIFRLVNSDVYYVESESTNNVFYYVKYNPDVFEWCSCLDQSTRGTKCKHIFSIEFAIRLGTLKYIERLPAEAKRYPQKAAVVQQSKSYRDDDYSF